MKERWNALGRNAAAPALDSRRVSQPDQFDGLLWEPSSKMWLGPQPNSVDILRKKKKLRCYPLTAWKLLRFCHKSAYAIKFKRLCNKISAYAIKNIGTLWNFAKHLHQNRPKPQKVSAPEPSGTSPSIFSTKTLRNLTSLCTGTFRNLTRDLPRNLITQPHHASSPRPSGTSSSGSFTGNFRNLTRYLHQNPLEPNQVSTVTLRNLTQYLHRKLPEPHKVSALEPSGTSQGICTGTLRNRTEPSGASAGIFIHRNPPEPHEVPAPEPSGTLSGTWCWSCTGSHRS